jgi:DNA-binding SARP family transcriptional activator/DNA-binding XRE family transcriptional regulator
MARGHDGKSHISPGALIRQYREQRGMTQRELADTAGISLGALRDLEQGRTLFPRWAALEALAVVLRIGEEQRAGLRSGSPATARRARRMPRAAGPSSGPGVQIDVLGPLAAWREGARVALGSVRQRAVLGLLALHHGIGLHRDAIVDALWDEQPPASAVAEVQGYLSRIRRLLGVGRAQAGTLIVTVGASYRLEADTGQLDLAAFRRHVRDARHAEARGERASACESYERALELWRGDVLADVELLRGHGAVVELTRCRADAVMRYAATAAESGAHAAALPHLRKLCARERLNEQAHAHLMIALAATGQQAEALRIFGDLRQRLDEELGICPGEQLAQVHLQVLRHQFGAR